MNNKENKKVVVDNYKLNSESISLDYFFTCKKGLFTVINNILFETSKLDKYNVLFDLNEWFISEDIYYVSLVDYINSCMFNNTARLYLDDIRCEILNKQFEKIKKEIANIIAKKVN